MPVVLLYYSIMLLVDDVVVFSVKSNMFPSPPPSRCFSQYNTQPAYQSDAGR